MLNLTRKQRFIGLKNRLKFKIFDLLGIKVKPKCITLTSKVYLDAEDTYQKLEEQGAIDHMADQIRRDIDQQILGDVIEQAEKEQ